MSDSPARKSSRGTIRGSLGRRGRRLARYALGFITVVLVIDAIVGEKGLLALLKARRDFSAVEQALEQARRATSICASRRGVSAKIPPPSKKWPAASSA